MLTSLLITSDIGFFGRKAVELQQKFPCVTSFMLSLNFVANHKVYGEHAPLIGMMRLFNNSPREVMAKQSHWYAHVACCLYVESKTRHRS